MHTHMGHGTCHVHVMCMRMHMCMHMHMHMCMHMSHVHVHVHAHVTCPCTCHMSHACTAYAHGRPAHSPPTSSGAYTACLLHIHSTPSARLLRMLYLL